MNEKNRLVWIDSLKLIACFSVFVGHYFAAFYSMCNLKPDLNKVFVFFMDSFLYIFRAGNFWVCVFFIISGYFAYKKSINSFRQLILFCLKRYLFFALSIFIVNLLVFIVYKTFGFHNIVVGNVLENEWLSSFYSFTPTLKDVFLGAIVLDSNLNGVLWMIRPLFVANITIYLLKYIQGKSKKRMIIATLLFVIIISLMGIFKNNFWYSLVCLLGISLHFIWKWFDEKKPNHTLSRVIIFIVPLFLGGGYWIKTYLFEQGQYITFLFSNPFINTIIGFLGINAIYCDKQVKDLMEHKLLKSLNNLSFSIFLLHWPIICSLSMWLFNQNTYGLFIIFIITSVVLIILAYLYDISINKAIKLILKFLDRVINNLKKNSR